MRVDLHLPEGRAVCPDGASYVAGEHGTISDDERSKTREARNPFRKIGGREVETLEACQAYSLVLAVGVGPDPLGHHVGNLDDNGVEVESAASTADLELLEWRTEELGFQTGIVAGEVLEMRVQVAELQSLDPAAVRVERTPEARHDDGPPKTYRRLNVEDVGVDSGRLIVDAVEQRQCYCCHAPA